MIHLNEKAFYRRKELAEMLGISSNTLQRFVDCGALPTRKLSQHYIFQGSDILEFLENLPKKSPKNAPNGFND